MTLQASNDPSVEHDSDNGPRTGQTFRSPSKNTGQNIRAFRDKVVAFRMSLGKSPNTKVTGDQHLRLFWKRLLQKYDIGSKVMDAGELAWLLNCVMGCVSWIYNELDHIIGPHQPGVTGLLCQEVALVSRPLMIIASLRLTTYVKFLDGGPFDRAQFKVKIFKFYPLPLPPSP